MNEFIWNGESSHAHGVIVVAYPPIQRAQERAETTIVPGRAGDLTLIEGQDVYDSYVKTMRIANKRGTDVQEIIRWLSGSGWISFGNDPGWEYEVRMLNSVQLDKVFKGVWQGSIQMRTQPFRRKTNKGPDLQISASNTRIYNPGDVASKPVITVRGTGSVRLTIGGQSVGINLRGGTVVLDCAAGIATNEAGTESLDAYITGTPPTIPKGESRITWASVNNGSVSSVRIRPEWRWL